MRLISIGDKNILINPEQIDYIEQKTLGVTEVTYICVGGKEFFLQISLDEFFKVLEDVDKKQFFGG